jgi:(E)-benzylidenesuccinyl-CoA hydratase
VGFATLLYEKADGVATLTLNRPERHNAFNLQMAAELREAWTDIKADPAVVCAIVTGAGDKAFCTGFDVADVASGSTAGDEKIAYDDSPILKLTAIHNHCWKPVITAVNGMVNGGGLHFIADSDLIVAAEHATFFDTHVKVGLLSALEPVGLARRIPLEAVLRMSLLGGAERMSAADAKQIGLVGEVVPLADLLPRARELAAKIAQQSPTALAGTKRAIWESLDRGLQDGLRHAWDLVGEHGASPDPLEGARAFVEKRKPRWSPYRD